MTTYALPRRPRLGLFFVTLLAVVLAAEMQDRIGQPIVVENKSGASGVTGAT